MEIPSPSNVHKYAPEINIETIPQVFALTNVLIAHSPTTSLGIVQVGALQVTSLKT